MRIVATIIALLLVAALRGEDIELVYHPFKPNEPKISIELPEEGLPVDATSSKGFQIFVPRLHRQSQLRMLEIRIGLSSFHLLPDPDFSTDEMAVYYIVSNQSFISGARIAAWYRKEEGSKISDQAYMWKIKKKDPTN